MTRDVVEEIALHSKMVANCATAFWGFPTYWPAPDAVAEAARELKAQYPEMTIDGIAEMARVKAERAVIISDKAGMKSVDAGKTFNALRESVIAKIRWWRPASTGERAALDEALKVAEAAVVASQGLVKAMCFALAIWETLDAEAEKEVRSPEALDARLEKWMIDHNT